MANIHGNGTMLIMLRAEQTENFDVLRREKLMTLFLG
jgi:hypothetical protein